MNAKVSDLVGQNKGLPAGEREGWRPISTAPKDGTVIDLWMVYHDVYRTDARRMTNCHFDGSRWRGEFGGQLDWEELDASNNDAPRSDGPTYWMPLPAPPVIAEDATPKPSNIGEK